MSLLPLAMLKLLNGIKKKTGQNFESGISILNYKFINEYFSKLTFFGVIV